MNTCQVSAQMGAQSHKQTCKCNAPLAFASGLCLPSLATRSDMRALLLSSFLQAARVPGHRQESWHNLESLQGDPTAGYIHTKWPLRADEHLKSSSVSIFASLLNFFGNEELPSTLELLPTEALMFIAQQSSTSQP
eukprot:gb/GFBE01046980.1/.p1 GENE.gb/GFBE01046980.1/~~gb/GFBE01046980.1/.p1  ORF type:complete len:136 (+),score=20.85 gb/GFBE01046980.1/:1-408(+)